MTTKKSNTKKEASKSMQDVTKASRVAVGSTSRPVIVGHRPLLKQDPMMSAHDNSEKLPAQEDESKIKTTSREQTVEPIANKVPEEPKVLQKAAVEPEKENDEPAPTNSAAVNALAGEVSAQREAEQADEKNTKKQAELEELIASRKYFVPVGEVSKRRMNRIIISFVVFVILAVVAINFAIDAELLDIGIQALTNLL